MYASRIHVDRQLSCSMHNLKGHSPGINGSKSKNFGKIQLSRQLSHLNVYFLKYIHVSVIMIKFNFGHESSYLVYAFVVLEKLS